MPKSIASRVRATYHKYPKWTSVQIALEVGCQPCYARQALYASKLKLANSKTKPKLMDWERQAIIDAHGEKQAAVAAEFNVSITCVSSIWRAAGVQKQPPYRRKVYGQADNKSAQGSPIE